MPLHYSYPKKYNIALSNHDKPLPFLVAHYLYPYLHDLADKVLGHLVGVLYCYYNSLLVPLL